MPNKRKSIYENCRAVVRACLNIVEEKGDTYVAIHKDDDVECVVLVSMIRSYPILSIVVADKLLFAEENAADMYQAANELNSESITGWHSIMLSSQTSIYMYRQCLWINAQLNRDYLMEMLCQSIAEYKKGKLHLASALREGEKTPNNTEEEVH